MIDLLSAYSEKLQSEALQSDPGQLPILEALDDLCARLAGSKRLFKRRAGPRGLYIHGPVGRGKSMLMDLFFEAAPVPAKRRVHFNAFMLDIHHRLHAERGKGGDFFQRVAATIAGDTSLLCFDEFQVSDIADAMILARLFTALFDRGVTVVATSNVAPVDLYKGGLQRALFLPFIHLLRDKLDVVGIGEGVDHRRARLAGRPAWFTPDDAAATNALDLLFAGIAEGQHMAPCDLDVDGRILHVARAAGRAARFTFDELCRQPLGAADYLAIAIRFDMVFLAHVPVFTPLARNEAVRFITLVDQLYEKHAWLAAAAAAHFNDLYSADGQYSFEYRRTASRLAEMQSDGYLAALPVR